VILLLQPSDIVLFSDYYLYLLKWCAQHDGFVIADRNSVIVQDHFAALVRSKTAQQLEKWVGLEHEAVFQSRRNHVGRVNRQPEEKNSGAPTKKLSRKLSIRHFRARRRAKQRSKTIVFRKFLIGIVGKTLSATRVGNFDSFERQVGESQMSQEQVINQIPLAVHAFYRNGPAGASILIGIS
jgi:hypothetical protein